MMVATALVHGLVLVTRNVSDVSWTGASYLDPFGPARA
jgi:predicted nucleic acid-binding protein